ncbi:DUF2845 domain-containing protein [Salinisphaera sp. T31B1]|uniref:DUF2845 domain-containing protein n=1 Tax=Salinisphaera sp. T31B1 TaxID=727963 RepID=UPI003341A185
MTRSGQTVLAGLLLVIGVLVLSSAPAHADSLRCGGSLIQTGDPAVVVRNACGAPDFVDPWIGGAGVGYGGGLSMEEWTYNRGPSRLLQILVFRNGDLYRIRDGGYGFNANAASGRCRPADISRGISKYRLLAMCGEPAQRNVIGYIYSSRGRTAQGDYYLRRGVIPVYREQWIYNFGGNRLLREITLENATVVETDTLQRGFD